MNLSVGLIYSDNFSEDLFRHNLKLGPIAPEQLLRQIFYTAVKGRGIPKRAAAAAEEAFNHSFASKASFFCSQEKLTNLTNYEKIQ